MNSISEAMRFALVGVCSEVLYIVLFMGTTQLGLNAVCAVAVAGGLCTLLNAELHARFSFRSRNTAVKTLRYLLIQLFCLSVSLLLAQVLTAAGLNSLLIGLATVCLWALISFVLTRRLHRSAAQH